MKLFDANELLNNVKTENMLLLNKVKNLELELSIAREQTDRSASFKHILHKIQGIFELGWRKQNHTQ